MARKNFADRLLEAIRKAVRPYAIEVTLCNFGSAIQGVGVGMNPDNSDSAFWIRLEPSRDGGIVMDISNIYLSPCIQRRGILTNLINNVEKLPEIDQVIISSVTTPEIQQFCLKRNMVRHIARYGFVETRGVNM